MKLHMRLNCTIDSYYEKGIVSLGCKFLNGILFMKIICVVKQQFFIRAEILFNMCQSNGSCYT